MLSSLLPLTLAYAFATGAGEHGASALHRSSLQRWRETSTVGTLSFSAPVRNGRVALAALEVTLALETSATLAQHVCSCVGVTAGGHAEPRPICASNPGMDAALVRDMKL